MSQSTVALIIAIVSLSGTLAVAVMNAINQRRLAHLQTGHQRELARLEGARERDRPMAQGVSAVRLQEYSKVPAMLFRISRMMPAPGPEDARVTYNDLAEWRYGPACLVISREASKALVDLLGRIRARYKEHEYFVELRANNFQGAVFRDGKSDHGLEKVEAAIAAFEMDSLHKLFGAKDRLLAAMRHDLLMRSEEALWATYSPPHSDRFVLDTHEGEPSVPIYLEAIERMSQLTSRIGEITGTELKRNGE